MLSTKAEIARIYLRSLISAGSLFELASVLLAWRQVQFTALLKDDALITPDNELLVEVEIVRGFTAFGASRACVIRFYMGRSTPELKTIYSKRDYSGVPPCASIIAFPDGECVYVADIMACEDRTFVRLARQALTAQFTKHLGS